MNSQEDFLKRLITALENAKIPYMVSGSVGSSLHGRPRATNDVDIVISPTSEQLDNFTASLGKDYYVSQDAAREAFNRNSMFNIIDTQTGWKADLIIRRDRPYSIEEFRRRRTVKMMGVEIWTLSPEDVILSKLEWSKDRQSEHQSQDALGVAVVQWDNLDIEYLQKWAAQLNIADQLRKLLDKAKKLKK